MGKPSFHLKKPNVLALSIAIIVNSVISFILLHPLLTVMLTVKMTYLSVQWGNRWNREKTLKRSAKASNCVVCSGVLLAQVPCWPLSLKAVGKHRRWKTLKTTGAAHTQRHTQLPRLVKSFYYFYSGIRGGYSDSEGGMVRMSIMWLLTHRMSGGTMAALTPTDETEKRNAFTPETSCDSYACPDRKSGYSEQMDTMEKALDMTDIEDIERKYEDLDELAIGQLA